MKRPLKTLTCLSSWIAFWGLQIATLPAPVQAQTANSNAGCPVGTRESSPNNNFVRNPIFSTNAGTGNGTPTPATPPPFAPFPTVLDFQTDLPYRGDAVYPNDGGGGGLSIQNETFNGGQIPLAPTGVVNGRGVTAAEAAQVGLNQASIPTYLYSNPNLRQDATSSFIGAPPIIWAQTITGLSGSTVYNFKALFFNLLVEGAPGVPPQIRLQVAQPNSALSTPPTIQTTTPIVVGDGSPIPGFPNIANNRQAWIPVQFSFTTAPGQTSVQLRIVDQAQNITGDDFGLTAIGFRECIPNIGVAKQAGTPVQNADGSYTIPYSIVVKNLAPAGIPDPYVLNNVQLAENLAQTFANATIVAIGNLQSQTLRVNQGFNGTSNTNLLQDNINSLAAGASGSVTFTVTIIPGSGVDGFGPYTNQVEATGNSNSGVRVADLSNDGTNPDPDGDGDGGNNNIPTIARLTGQANVLLVKRITNITRNGASLSGINFGAFVDDPNTTDDTNSGWTQLTQGAPVGIINLNANTLLQAGDEVEYTVYFLSNGVVPAIAPNICDQIPPGATLIPLSNQVQIGTGSLQPAGTVFTPLAPLPANNPCLNQNNPNGSVIFSLGDLANAAPDNVGFVRLRVRIQ